MAQGVQFLLRCSLQAFLTLTVLVNAHAQGNSRQDAVARIADRYTITFAELEQHVRDFQYAYRFRDHLAKGFQAALDDMALNQLKRVDFFALGLNKTAESQPSIKRTITEELVTQYYDTRFYRKYVSEDSLQHAYKEMGKEVVYQQIILARPDSASRNESDSLRALAEAIRIRMRKGEEGGGLRTLDWKNSLGNNVSYAIFHLPVNDVQIFEGNASIHVVKVVRVDKKTVPPYTNVRAEIQKALEGRYRDISYEEFERAKKGLVDEKRAQWNSKALRQLVRWSKIPGFYQGAYSDTLGDAIAHGRNLVVLTCPTARVDLKEYLRLLDDVLTWGEHATVTQDDVKRFVLEAVRTSLIAKKAAQLGLENDVFSPGTANPILMSGIVRLYNQHEIEEQLPPATGPALKEFYQANRDSLYYQLAKVNIYAIINSDRSVLDGLKAKLQQNIPFEKLVPHILVKTYVRKRDGTLATYFGDEPPFLAEAAFRLRLNETAGPIEFVDPAKGNAYALIKCVGVREEKQLSYDDVKKTIAADFANYHRERIAQAIADRLKKKYTVTIYKDVLQKDLMSIGIRPD